MNKTWLFLDFDNTLMATEQYAVPSLIERFNQLYADRISHPLNETIFKQYFHGQARESLCQQLSEYFKIDVDYALLYEGREWQVMQYFKQLPHGVPMASSLIEVLSEFASKGIGLALVSNNPIQRALTAMRYADNQKGEQLAKLFGTAFFEADHLQKPKPDVYLRAMAQVNATPQNSFAVEDSLSGATAAITAGLSTFAFTGFSEDPSIAELQLIGKGCIASFQNWVAFPDIFYSKIV